MSKRLNSKDVASMIGGGNPLPPSDPGQIDNGDFIQVRHLKVDLVKAYSGNPRRASNERLLEIKDSIAIVGLQQRIHVTLHPKEGWVTARGGCTRLEALHGLAKEQPARFGEMDFLEVAFKDDIELTIAHLSENLQRTEMTFWDTAKGVMEMRDMFLKADRKDNPRASVMGVRDLEQRLKSNGLSVPYSALIDYAFLMESLVSIREVDRNKISRNDVRNALRPHYILLSEFAEKHFSIDRNTDFNSRYVAAVGLFSAEGEYSADRLIKHVNSILAVEMGLEDAELPAILAAFKLDKSAPLADLRCPTPPPGAAQQPPDDTPPGSSPSGAGAAGGTEDGAGATGASASSGQDASTAGDGDGDGDEGEGEGEGEGGAGAGAGADQSMGARRSPGEISGAPGLQVLGADKLQPLPANGQAQGPLGAGQPPQSQADLDGMSELDRAKDHLQDSLQALAEACGLGLWLNPDESMPSGFWVELPSEGAVVSSESILLHGWWFLANLSGQFSTAIEFVPLDSEYRAAIASEEAWQDAVAQRLSGAVFSGADFLVTLTTEPAHPLSDLGLKALAAMREWKFQQASAQGSQS